MSLMGKVLLTDLKARGHLITSLDPELKPSRTAFENSQAPEQPRTWRPSDEGMVYSIKTASIFSFKMTS